MSVRVTIGMSKWITKTSLQNQLAMIAHSALGQFTKLDLTGSISAEVKKMVGQKTLAIRVRQHTSEIFIPSEAIEYWLSVIGFSEAHVTAREKISEGDYLFLVDY